MSDEGKKLLEDVQTKLTAYQGELEKSIQGFIKTGLGESDKKVEDLKKEMEKVDITIKSLQQQIKYIGIGVPGLTDSLAKGEINFSTSNLIKALYKLSRPDECAGGNPWQGCEKEKEIVDTWTRELATRATGGHTADGSEGGYAIPPEVTGPISTIARAATPLLDKLPVTTLNGVYGQLIVPKITGGTTGYMVGENEAPTTSKMAYGQVTLDPRRAAGLSFLSKSLLYQTRGSIDTVIQNDLGKALGNKKHEMLITGNGNEHQPCGILHSKWGIATSTIAGDTNGGRFNMTDALLAKAELEEANEGDGAPTDYGFLMRPMVKAGIATERIKQYSEQAVKRGQPVIQNMGFIDDAALAGIIGKYATTTHLSGTETKGSDTTKTLSSVLYGNWSYFWIVNWQGMTIRVSDVAYVGGISAFAQNGMWIIVEEGFNCAVLRPASFRRITGAQVNPTQWA